ncbi:MAG: sporulation protein YabP [Alkaliphilus sp.]
MSETRNERKILHNVMLESRNKLSLTGIESVESFNSELIVLKTPEEILTVKGLGMNINKLSLEDGNVRVKGKVYSIVYTTKGVLGAKGIGFLSKLFK